MAEQFFTSKQAAQITGCSLRQLQYWREKGVVVPSISATGTGRSIYYSRSELVELATMEYCLSVGLTFEAAANALQMLKQKEPLDFNSVMTKRFMLSWSAEAKKINLLEFDRDKAIAFLDRGQPVIPVWLDVIDQQLARKLKHLTSFF